MAAGSLPCKQPQFYTFPIDILQFSVAATHSQNAYRTCTECQVLPEAQICLARSGDAALKIQLRMNAEAHGHETLGLLTYRNLDIAYWYSAGCPAGVCFA
jgi:hypothetical protein